MTIPVLKIRVAPKSLLKGKMDVRFPTSVVATKFLTATKVNGIYNFDVDYTLLDASPFSDPANTFVAILDATSDSYKITTLSALISGTTGIDQHITAAGPADVLANAGIVRVDQTVGAAITLTMPLSSVKTCPVLLSDWKGDAGTNNITVNASGSDVFPGGITSFKIDGDTASRFLRPVSGVGYAW